MNRIFLHGRLGKDVELFTTEGGNHIATLSVATNDREKKDGEYVDVTEWHTCKVFGKRAEIASKYLAKGSDVVIEGKIKTRSWEQEGKKRYIQEVIVNNLEFAGKPAAKQETHVGGMPF